MSDDYEVAKIDASFSVNNRGGSVYHIVAPTGMGLCGAGPLFTDEDWRAHEVPERICKRCLKIRASASVKGNA